MSIPYSVYFVNKYYINYLNNCAAYWHIYPQRKTRHTGRVLSCTFKAL